VHHHDIEERIAEPIGGIAEEGDIGYVLGLNGVPMIYIEWVLT
jgi:hypothetical protein